MKLESVHSIGQALKDGTSYTEAVFSRGGNEVVKRFRIDGSPERVNESLYQISRNMREADRDLAYAVHGKDFRKYCEYQDNFWDPLPIETLMPVYNRILEIENASPEH